MRVLPFFRNTFLSALSIGALTIGFWPVGFSESAESKPSKTQATGNFNFGFGLDGQGMFQGQMDFACDMPWEQVKQMFQAMIGPASLVCSSEFDKGASTLAPIASGCSVPGEPKSSISCGQIKDKKVKEIKAANCDVLEGLVCQRTRLDQAKTMAKCLQTQSEKLNTMLGQIENHIRDGLDFDKGQIAIAEKEKQGRQKFNDLLAEDQAKVGAALNEIQAFNTIEFGSVTNAANAARQSGGGVETIEMLALNNKQIEDMEQSILDGEAILIAAEAKSCMTTPGAGSYRCESSGDVVSPIDYLQCEYEGRLNVQAGVATAGGSVVGGAAGAAVTGTIARTVSKKKAREWRAFLDSITNQMPADRNFPQGNPSGDQQAIQSFAEQIKAFNNQPRQFLTPGKAKSFMERSGANKRFAAKGFNAEGMFTELMNFCFNVARDRVQSGKFTGSGSSSQARALNPIISAKKGVDEMRAELFRKLNDKADLYRRQFDRLGKIITKSPFGDPFLKCHGESDLELKIQCLRNTGKAVFRGLENGGVGAFTGNFTYSAGFTPDPEDPTETNFFCNSLTACRDELTKRASTNQTKLQFVISKKKEFIQSSQTAFKRYVGKIRQGFAVENKKLDGQIALLNRLLGEAGSTESVEFSTIDPEDFDSLETSDGDGPDGKGVFKSPTSIEGFIGGAAKPPMRKIDPRDLGAVEKASTAASNSLGEKMAKVDEANQELDEKIEECINKDQENIEKRLKELAERWEDSNCGLLGDFCKKSQKALEDLVVDVGDIVTELSGSFQKLSGSTLSLGGVDGVSCNDEQSIAQFKAVKNPKLGPCKTALASLEELFGGENPATKTPADVDKAVAELYTGAMPIALRGQVTKYKAALSSYKNDKCAEIIEAASGADDTLGQKQTPKLSRCNSIFNDIKSAKTDLSKTQKRLKGFKSSSGKD